MIPAVLQDIAGYLSGEAIQLVSTAHDARADSMASERHVVQILQNAGR